MNIKFKAKIENGKCVFFEPLKFKTHCQNLEGKEVSVTVSKWKKPRSDNQNAYYWGLIINILSQEFGYSSDEMHEALKVLFLTDHSGKIPKVKSTSFLSTIEFEEFLTKIRTWANVEHSIFIPLPGEVEY